jgi:hypothetical protein
MTSEQAIAMLDRQIARNKQTVTLRKLPSTDITVPALVRSSTATELIGGLTQGESLVIVSPTQINAAGWPGVQEAGKSDVRVPSKNRGDSVVINNQNRVVQNANPFYINDVLVRIEIVVK